MKERELKKVHNFKCPSSVANWIVSLITESIHILYCATLCK